MKKSLSLLNQCLKGTVKWVKSILSFNIFLFSFGRLIKKMCRTIRLKGWNMKMTLTIGQYYYGCPSVALVFLQLFVFSSAFFISLRKKARNIDGLCINSRFRMLKSSGVHMKRSEMFQWLLTIIFIHRKKRMRKSIRTWKRLSWVIFEFSIDVQSNRSFLSHSI